MKRIVQYEITGCGPICPHYSEHGDVFCNKINAYTNSPSDNMPFPINCPLPTVPEPDGCWNCSVRKICVSAKDNKKCMGYAKDKI